MRPTVPLYLEIASRILDEHDGSLSPTGKQLPSEADLSSGYGVSRSTVREALSYLSSRNRVRKIHGIGTFLLPAPERILDGIETLGAYVETIARSGRNPGDIVLSAEWSAVPADLAETRYQHTVNVGEGLLEHRAIKITSLRTANDIEIIYCHDYILPPFASRTNPDEVMRQRTAGQSLLDIVEEKVGADLQFSQLYARAVVARDQVAGALNVPVGSPILELRGVTYADVNEPAYFSRNWFLTDEYEFQIVRRKAHTTEAAN